jgi:hypothetical protein
MRSFYVSDGEIVAEEILTSASTPQTYCVLIATSVTWEPESWCAVIAWPNGVTERIKDFASEIESEKWILTESGDWLIGRL